MSWSHVNLLFGSVLVVVIVMLDFWYFYNYIFK